MLQIIFSLAAGTIFGAGLTISQMVDPRVVLGFLDIARLRDGTWNPTLIAVFVAALAVTFVAFAIQRRMTQPLCAAQFHIPGTGSVDARLLGGSVLFGIGWGLLGVCPGPALTALALAGSQVGGFVLFVAAMLAGMALSWLVAADGPEPAAGPVSQDD